MAYMTGDTTLTIRTRGCWDRDSTQTCLTHSIRIAPGGVYQQPDWSADGQWLVFLGVQPQGLVVLSASCLDVREGCSDTLKRLAINRWPLYWPSLSDEGMQVLYAAETPDGIGQLYLFDVVTEHIQQLTFIQGGASVPDWSQDGNYLAYAGFRSRSDGDLGIYLLDMERHLSVRVISQPGVDFTYPAWSP